MSNPNSFNKICVVIPVYNRCEETLNCLDLLAKSDFGSYDVSIVVVDDGSNDGTYEKVQLKYPKVILLRGNGNLWWSGATNLGVQYALDHDFDFVLNLNDDVDFGPDFILKLLETAKSNKSAIVYGIVCDIDNKRKIISAGKYPKGFLNYNYSGYMSGLDIDNLPTEPFESTIGTGLAMLVPKRVFIEIGLFDQKRFPHHIGDMDFLLRATRKGFIVLQNPSAHIYTKIGENYFHNQIINKNLISNLKSFFDVKSTVYLPVRWEFCLRHTPYFLGVISFIYFLIRMFAALVMKLILPKKTLAKIISTRV